MEMNTLQKELTDLYQTSMGYEFQKATYDKRMDALKEEHAELLRETAHACDASDENLENLAACIPEYVSEQLAEEPSKRKRERKSIEHKMNMVSYFVPLLGTMPSGKAGKLTERIVEIWNEKMPEYKISHSTYESIRAGFQKGLFCYITTAVCKNFDKPDDCYELTVLRQYRDSYLLKSQSGRRLVEEYYNIAPTIVKRINKQKDAGEIYRGIWEMYLNPCIWLIEENKKEECREVYSRMVRGLEREYLTEWQRGDGR